MNTIIMYMYIHWPLIKCCLFKIGTDIKVCPSFCTAIEMIDDENYVAADGRHIYICQKNTYVKYITLEKISFHKPERLLPTLSDKSNFSQERSNYN